MKEIESCENREETYLLNRKANEETMQAQGKQVDPDKFDNSSILCCACTEMLLVPLTAEQLDHIQENPERFNRRLQNIKEWFLEQPHLPDKWDDECLANFLRACGCVENCKSKLDMYFTVRTAFPEIFAHRDVNTEELQKVLRNLDVAVLPNLTADAKRIVIGRISSSGQTLDYTHIIKLFFMVADLLLKLEKTQISGNVCIIYAGQSLGTHFLKVNSMVFKKFFLCVKEALCFMVKEVHIVNVSSSVALLLDVLKSFLNDELREVVRIHANIETLYEFVPRCALPEEYGGSAGTLMGAKYQWVKTMEEFGGWFEEQDGVKVDEGKRPGRAFCLEDLYEFEEVLSNQ